MITFSAVTLGLFAVLSLPLAFFSSRGLFVTVGLTCAAFFEFRGRAAVARLEQRGVRTLTRNQIALTGTLTVYCFWSMLSAWFGPDTYTEAIRANPEIEELLAPLAGMIRELTVMIYAVVLIVGWVVQALVIRYYHTRRRPIQRYLAETPAWILDWNQPGRSNDLVSRRSK